MKSAIFQKLENNKVSLIKTVSQRETHKFGMICEYPTLIVVIEMYFTTRCLFIGKRKKEYNCSY